MVTRPNYSALKGCMFLMPQPDMAVAKMIHRFGGQWTRSVEAEFNGVIFTGGEDVSPFLYGEPPLPNTRCNIRRDMREVYVYKNVPMEMPKIGICRGGQLLNIMCGGRMWQHVDNHTRHHSVTVFNDTKIMVSSTHHQMMIPGDNGVVLGWAAESKRKERHNETVSLKDNNHDDAEIVYYEQQNSLCFQPHPEYANYDDCTNLFIELVRTLYDDDSKQNPGSVGSPAQ